MGRSKAGAVGPSQALRCNGFEALDSPRPGGPPAGWTLATTSPGPLFRRNRDSDRAVSFQAGRLAMPLALPEPPGFLCPKGRVLYHYRGGYIMTPDYCIRNPRPESCEDCSLVSYGRDCRNRPIDGGEQTVQTPFEMMIDEAMNRVRCLWHGDKPN
jgi:hypothetical protein